MMATPKPFTILILGGGISGLTTALALTKFFLSSHLPAPQIHIFEIRPVPATVGGAVNLTPNALRMLDALGALSHIRSANYGRTIDYLQVFDLHSGTQLATSSFEGPRGKGIGDPPYKALRITRGDALRGVLAAVEECENITMTCGKKTVGIEERSDGVTIRFEDGGKANGDMLMGCDGIHSVVRSLHVDPERKPTYSGICNAFAFAKLDEDVPKVHFDCTAMNFARRGMLLTSWHSSREDSVYVGALMEVEDVGSRDGWKARGGEEKKTREMLLERFGEDCGIDCVRPLIERADGFFLWPVYTLSKDGRWHTERCMLLGDAAVSTLSIQLFIPPQ
jgi:salicylate hydroxylase